MNWTFCMTIKSLPHIKIEYKNSTGITTTTTNFITYLPLEIPFNITFIPSILKTACKDGGYRE